METINFCNYNWTTAMENGRMIHTDMPWMWYDPMQVHIDGNIASLTIEKKPNIIIYGGHTYHPNTATAVMRSVETFGYGIFSAEIRMPKGKNLWPAFWLVGDGKWPNNGEIDICEGYTRENGSYYHFPLSCDIESNVHYINNGQHAEAGAQRVCLLSALNPTNKFVRYEVRWSENEIIFLVNGKKVRTIPEHIVKQLQNTKQRVIFDLWTSSKNASMDTEMEIINFNYTKL